MSYIKLFQDKKIRSEWNSIEEQWYFSVIDIVELLTDSANPTDYLKKMRKRDTELGLFLGTNCPQVEMLTNGVKRKVLAGSVQHIFRIIQSIPSPKAEPFKLWLAQIANDRVQEIENPELAQERMKELYEQKGYPKDWIDKRLRGIAIRQNLTDEWKERGISSERDFSILTAEISKATFGVTSSEHKDIKGLSKKSHNLRDHMTDLELIFTMLGERVTTEISQIEKPDTFDKNKKVAKRGGNTAGGARKQAEKELGKSVVSKQNYLQDKLENQKNEKSVE